MAERSFSIGTQPDGMIEFHIDIKVAMSEIGTWTPERIEAFFKGVAEVTSASRRATELPAARNDG